jgi:predicted transcriptional regulator YheO
MADIADQRGERAAALEGGDVDRFAAIRPLVPAIAATFGPLCEVVLHDFSRPENSIIEIAGVLTERHIGGSVSQLGLKIMGAGDDAEDQYNYITRAPNGRVLKSTTVPLRDHEGHVFGALCINVDITDLRRVSDVLDGLVGSVAREQPPHPIGFFDDIDEVLGEVIEEIQTAVGRPLDRLDRETRLEILRALDQRGVFSLQRSVPQVADRLGVSRPTIYSYLRQIRE